MCFLITLSCPVPPLQVSEDRLVSMLEQINEKQGGSGPKITIQRRRAAFDDDD